MARRTDHFPIYAPTTSDAFRTALHALVERADAADIDVEGGWGFRTTEGGWHIEIDRLASSD